MTWDGVCNDDDATAGEEITDFLYKKNKKGLCIPPRIKDHEQVS